MDEATRIALAALADGALDPAARDELLARVAASPELQEALRDQRFAQAAIASAETRAPASLHFAVAGMVEEARAAKAIVEERGTRRGWRHRDAARARRHVLARPRAAVLALGGGVAAFAAALAVLVSGGQPGGPSVAEAAQVALSTAMRPAPAPQPGTLQLKASFDGIPYPYWEDSAGWDAVGARRDEIKGRRVMTVFYGNDRHQRIGYTIASGHALSATGGQWIRHGGDSFRVLHRDGATIVSWLRNGHTCILAARNVDAQLLVQLASWET